MTPPTPQRPPQVADDQRLYARLLDWGTWAGFAALAAGFLAYVTGLLPGDVALPSLPALWSLSATAFRAQGGGAAGWAWLAHLDRGDSASLLGIALLAGSTLVCVAAMIPVYLRRRDLGYAAICGLAVLVMLVAISGLLHPR